MQWQYATTRARMKGKEGHLCLCPATVSLGPSLSAAASRLDVLRVHLGKEGHVHGASQRWRVLIPGTTSW